MILTPDELTQIKSQAVKEYPHECCGVIFVKDGDDSSRLLFPCRNQQNELHAVDKVRYPRDATTAYSIHHLDLRSIEEYMRKGYRMAVLYHSHIDAGAYFSETDRHGAMFDDEHPTYPDTVYLVVSVRGGSPPYVDATVAVRWSEQARKFAELPFEAS